MKDTLSLQELFNNRLFKVPLYQRGYAWEEQQVQEFLDDLELLHTSRRHYTGTIVLHQPNSTRKVRDNEGTLYEEVDVVDGQQRLTTIVILLNEISKSLKQHTENGSLAEGIRKKHVWVSDSDNQPLYKLSLNENTNHFFRSNIVPDSPQSHLGPSVASAQRLLKAKNLISDYLTEANAEHTHPTKWLEQLYSKVADQLQFSLYEVEEESEVGVIFEVMNDRGKQLTNLEKVKNYLLYAASALNITPDNKKTLTDSVNQAWAGILKQLMAANLGSPANENQLLRANWLMEYDPQPRNWQGSKSIRGKFDLRKQDHNLLLQALHDYVEGLHNSCISYCDALNPSRTGSFGLYEERVRDEVIHWSLKLARIGTTATFLPLLMAMRKLWPSDAERYLEILKLCETFAFRVYRVARYFASYRQPAMFRLANRVAQRETGFSEVLKEIKSNYGGREQRQSFDRFTNPDNFNIRFGWTGLRYFLYEYETHLAQVRGGSPKVDWSEIDGENTIEHILPQKIGDQPYWLDRFDEDSHNKYRHDLGNLTLTKGNSLLGNKPYPDKRGDKASEKYCYENSLLLVEREIANEWDDWTATSIRDRRTRLLNWAKKRWQVDFGDSQGEMYDPVDESEDEDVTD